MLKLHQIFYRRFIALFAVSLLFVGYLTYAAIKTIEFNFVEENLKSNLLISELQIKNAPSLDEFAHTLKVVTGLRITIIDMNGHVVAESDRNKIYLANHLHRPEVVEASKNEFGKHIRKSDTVDKDMLYVAKKVSTVNGVYYLRVAKYVDDFSEEFLDLSLKVLFLMVVFFLIALWLGFNLNNRIKYEIDKIAIFLKSLVGKNFDIKIESEFSNEFNKIANSLNKVAEKLKKREEKKVKHTNKLMQLNRQKDEIISAISHEFKNPIAVITGYCETLNNEKDIKPEIMRKFLNKIFSNANRLSAMIDRLRLATKLEDKKFQATFTQCDLNMICERICSNVKIEYPKREITFKSLSDKQILADEVLLEMAILNLVENALKYSEEMVFITFYDHKIEVQDSGIGIAEEDLNKITSKFYRINSNVWNNSLGLGLSIVTNILKILKFELQIKSKLGEGSVFEILFHESDIHKK